MDEKDESSWQSLWNSLAALQEFARRLRHLSQVEPLLQARPDYPRARITRSHAGEVWDVLEGIAATLTEVKALLPQVLPDMRRSPGVAPEEEPRAVEGRIDTLARLVATLQREAFQPLPRLPPHSPPYLVEPPGHDLAGTKAVLLSFAIDETTTALRNALLSALNDGGPSGQSA